MEIWLAPVGEAVVAREKSGRPISQRDHCRPGQCCQIDELGGTAPGGIDESIGKDKPTLGIGRENFHGYAVHSSNDVARSKCRT